MGHSDNPLDRFERLAAAAHLIETARDAVEDLLREKGAEVLSDYRNRCATLESLAAATSQNLSPVVLQQRAAAEMAYLIARSAVDGYLEATETLYSKSEIDRVLYDVAHDKKFQDVITSAAWTRVLKHLGWHICRVEEVAK